MNKLKTIILLLVTLAVEYSAEAQSWQLVWQDEFNHISSDWVFDIGRGSSGWGNNELQYYRRENASIENGQLVITAKREDYAGARYTSARLKTQGRKNFKYGKIEARIALPSSMGLWPAFWMLGSNISSVGWPACGEIDIMEHVNNAPDVHGTIHWRDHNGIYASYGGKTSTNVTQYHVYSIEWDDKTIKWFLDGNQYHVVDITNGVNGTSEFHNDFFLLLNLAVGGNWPGFNIDEGALPAKMYVDYVRVYEKGSIPPAYSFFKEAEQYSTMLGVRTENTTDTGGGLNVGWINNRDWMAYNSINIPVSGYYKVEYRVASIYGGRLSLDLNGGSIVLGSLNIPATGGWQNWRTISHTVYINAGSYNFGIYAQQGGWNINWWRITQIQNSLARTASVVEAREEQSLPHELRVFPNPVRGQLNIHRSDGKTGTMEILDSTGKAIMKDTLQSEYDVSGLKPGIYSIRINDGDQIMVRQFVKL